MSTVLPAEVALWASRSAGILPSTPTWPAGRVLRDALCTASHPGRRTAKNGFRPLAKPRLSKKRRSEPPSDSALSTSERKSGTA